MNEVVEISVEMMHDFFRAIKKDPRIAPAHISLYMVLLNSWISQGAKNPVMILSARVKLSAKISSTSTYHKRMKELHAYGYIRYLPSFDGYEGSKVYLLTLS